jgi:hypothetical protein
MPQFKVVNTCSVKFEAPDATSALRMLDLQEWPVHDLESYVLGFWPVLYKEVSPGIWKEVTR